MTRTKGSALPGMDYEWSLGALTSEHKLIRFGIVSG